MLTLKWDYPAVGTVTFNVYRTDSSWKGWQLITNVATNEWIFQAGSNAFFYVTATNAAGESQPNIK